MYFCLFFILLIYFFLFKLEIVPNCNAFMRLRLAKISLNHFCGDWNILSCSHFILFSRFAIDPSRAGLLFLTQFFNFALRPRIESRSCGLSSRKKGAAKKCRMQHPRPVFGQNIFPLFSKLATRLRFYESLKIAKISCNCINCGEIWKPFEGRMFWWSLFRDKLDSCFYEGDMWIKCSSPSRSQTSFWDDDCSLCNISINFMVYETGHKYWHFGQSWPQTENVDYVLTEHWFNVKNSVQCTLSCWSCVTYHLQFFLMEFR